MSKKSEQKPPHEGGKRRYAITHTDFGRHGYGYAEEDDPDKMEYLHAKEAFERYQQAATLPL